MEWLYIKNIQNLSSINLDKESKMALFKHYEKFYKEEKRVRHKMEKSLQEQYSALMKSH